MDLQQFKYFLQLCTDKNFATAADNLYITQQALRKSIKRLEIEAGTVLFYKSNDMMELTQAGMCMKAHARAIIDETSVLDKSLLQLTKNGSEVITIACSYGIYPVFALKLFSAFKKENPGIGLNIIEMQDSVCEDHIKNGDVDFGFCIGPNDSNYFHIQQIEKFDVCTMVNKTNPLSQREYLDLEDLEGQSLAIVNENFKLFHNFLSVCEEREFSPNIALRGGDVISVHNFSRFEKNISITVDFLAHDLLYNEHVIVPLNVPELTWTINMLIRKNAVLTKATKKFISFVHKVYS